MDQIDLFRIFLRVVECASFTRAAASLGLPRSSVSAAIRTLEQRVGAELLARTTHRVTPTRDGEAFYTRCQRLVTDVEEAEASFRRGEAAMSGVIKVNLPGRVGRLIVAPALPEFPDRYPAIRVELGLTDRAIDLIGEPEGRRCPVQADVRRSSVRAGPGPIAAIDCPRKAPGADPTASTRASSPSRRVRAAGPA